MTDHGKALRAAQDAVDEERPRWEAVLAERRRAVLHARADKVTIYRIAQLLGITQNAVRQILKLGTGAHPSHAGRSGDISA